MTGPGWCWGHDDSGASFGGLFEPHGPEPSHHPREQEAGSHAPASCKDWSHLPWGVPN